MEILIISWTQIVVRGEPSAGELENERAIDYVEPFRIVSFSLEMSYEDVEVSANGYQDLQLYKLKR